MRFRIFDGLGGCRRQGGAECNKSRQTKEQCAARIDRACISNALEEQFHEKDVFVSENRACPASHALPGTAQSISFFPNEALRRSRPGHANAAKDRNRAARHPLPVTRQSDTAWR